jgi:phosphoesterase RecJ-like protein
VIKEFEQFKTFLDSAGKIVLTTHINPDADGIGCEMALASYLRSKGKHVSIINHSETPDNLRFLDPARTILQFDEARHSASIKDADLICVLDINHPDRLASMKSCVLESEGKKVCIDHHLEPAPFADLYILDEPSTATGEIIYKLISYLDGNTLTKDIAEHLYAAIMTDTGSFRYPKTDPDIHRIIAHLIESGADPTIIYQRIYDQNTPNRIRLLGLALAGLKTACSEKVAYICVTRNMFKETGTTEADTDAFVPYTLSVEGTQIGLMFTELENNVVKISFRSKGDIWINKLAQEFGGNGHQNAAGARVHNADLSQVTNNVLDRAQHYVQ